EVMQWRQKKPPLKNQPSNPPTPLLRAGREESSRYLTEARLELLDPERRRILDEELAAQVVPAQKPIPVARLAEPSGCIEAGVGKRASVVSAPPPAAPIGPPFSVKILVFLLVSEGVDTD